MRTTLLLLCVAALLLAGGCASGKSKSSNRIYEGDGPSISYTNESESAGGRIGGR